MRFTFNKCNFHSQNGCAFNSCSFHCKTLTSTTINCRFFSSPFSICSFAYIRRYLNSDWYSILSQKLPNKLLSSYISKEFAKLKLKICKNRKEYRHLARISHVIPTRQETVSFSWNVKKTLIWKNEYQKSAKIIHHFQKANNYLWCEEKKC